MSLVTQIQALATRIATEFNTIRGEIQAGSSVELIQGSFANTDLSAGVLTISHSLGNVILPFLITDENNKMMIPDDVTFSNNSIAVDLGSFAPITGTWKYIFGGISGTIEGAVTSVNSQTGDVSLDADDIDDTTTTKKFVTAAEKSAWDGKSEITQSSTAPESPSVGDLWIDLS